MYPLQLLTGNVPLATILGMLATTLQPATVGRELMSTAFPPTVSEMPAPPTGTKQWCCLSNQEATTLRPEEEEAVGLDITPKEQFHQRQKEGWPLARLLKESHLEALGKDSKLFQVTRGCMSRHTASTTTMRGPTTFPTPSWRWPPPVASWALMSMGPGGMDWPKGLLGCSPCGKKFPKGHPFLLGGASCQITQDHGPKGNPFPVALRW